MSLKIPASPHQRTLKTHFNHLGFLSIQNKIVLNFFQKQRKPFEKVFLKDTNKAHYLGNALLSHDQVVVTSAKTGLTSVFEMGTGVPLSQ